MCVYSYSSQPQKCALLCHIDMEEARCIKRDNQNPIKSSLLTSTLWFAAPFNSLSSETAVLREEEGEDQRGRCQGPGPPRLGCCCCWVIGSTKSHTINHNSHTRLSSWEWWPPFPADYKQCHLLLVHTRQHIDFVCYEKKLTLGNQKDFKKISIPHKYLA